MRAKHLADIAARHGGRTALSGIVLMLLLTTILVAGCREVEENSELTRFVTELRKLPAAEYEDTLRSLSMGPAPAATYAHYELGNYFYGAFTDSITAAAARDSVVSWDPPIITALLDSAQLHFEQAIAHDSTFVEAYVNLGSLLDDRAERLESRDQEASRQRAELFQQAKAAYEQALEVSPSDEKAGCNLGALHLKLQEYPEAYKSFQNVLDAHPQSALAHYNMAIMFAEEQIYREAVAEWEAAAAADPEGDIGERSRANIEIVQDLLKADIPTNLKDDQGGAP
jgi:tetratricopeptide (TPR) repeat protein